MAKAKTPDSRPTNKRITTPQGMPQVMTRVGVLKGDRTYELPADIADDLVKTRGCKVAASKTTRKAAPAEQAEKR